MDASLIDRLARLRGIGDAYHDYRGELRYFTPETKAGILRAMGCAPDDPGALAAELGQLESERQRRLVPSIVTVRGRRAVLDLNIAARDFGASFRWAVGLEHGERLSGHLSTAECPEIWRGEIDGSWITRRRFELPLDLPIGYHELMVSVAGGPAARCLVISSPPECYEPAVIHEGRRVWGVAVQLYSVRSRENWGIGDFNDLKALIRWLAPRGAGFVGLNPLHALAPADPERASPYSASNRHFLNLLYISVPAVPEFRECAAACSRVADEQFARRLSELRAAPHVDYRCVAEVKFEILELLYRDFRERHLAHGTSRAAAFRGFIDAGGPLLSLHARFDALDHYFRATWNTASGWLSWPAEYRDATGAAAQRYAEEHPLQIEFQLYLQWLAHEQLAGAQGLARELGMPVGLYGDYAVGAHPSGSETWVDQRGYRMGAEIGAPPDPLAHKGQGWGIPPPDPLAMETEHLQGFIGLIRDNMRYYGALRLDHVMSLFRLWWVPAGFSPTEGAYVHYPLHSLLTALTLESSRSRCMVVGEDLGVVPDEVRHAMPEFGVYHYKVLLFEKQDGRFRRPDEYVRRALATASTHDLPTLRGFWEGRDIELRRRLQLYPDVEIANYVEREREHDRTALLAALRNEGLAPAAPGSSSEPFTADLTQALHLYLARSNTALVALQIEDLLGMADPVNVPGTNHEYPNWQRKLSSDLEDMVDRADLDRILSEINQARS
ncbi:MAG: 4-alpha-glucanotransferase [Steroidobacteraceae bacterium]